MVTRLLLLPTTVAAMSLAASCAPATPAAAPQNETTKKRDQPAPAGPKVTAEIGALAEDEVQKTFRNRMPAIEKCLDAGRSRLDLLAGKLGMRLRVDTEGRASLILITESGLGQHETEQCIREALGSGTWPRPQGGQNGIATQSIEVETAERPAVPWSADALGTEGDALRGALGDCRSQGGLSRLTVTLYVGTEGQVMSAGSSVETEELDQAKVDAAIACALKATKGRSFPSPGSYPAKVSVTVR